MLSDQPEQRYQGCCLVGKMILNDSRHRRTVLANSVALDSLALWQDLTQPRRSSRLIDEWLNLCWVFSGCLPALRSVQHQLQRMNHNIHEMQKEADLYLSLLYVDKTLRGQGVARTLLTPLLQRCDQQQHICGVDTFNPVNISLYQHFGFELYRQTAINDTVTNYCLLRRPQ